MSAICFDKCASVEEYSGQATRQCHDECMFIVNLLRLLSVGWWILSTHLCQNQVLDRALWEPKEIPR